jgi:hypothetical protein
LPLSHLTRQGHIRQHFRPHSVQSFIKGFFHFTEGGSRVLESPLGHPGYHFLTQGLPLVVKCLFHCFLPCAFGPLFLLSIFSLFPVRKKMCRTQFSKMCVKFADVEQDAILFGQIRQFVLRLLSPKMTRTQFLMVRVKPQKTVVRGA